jgi:uncharacterized protein YjdB
MRAFGRADRIRLKEDVEMALLPVRMSRIPGPARSCGALVVLCAAAMAQQPSLKISSPTGGAVVSSGQTLTVTVAASGANFQDVWLGGNLPPGVFFQQVPGTSYQFAAVIPATTSSGTYWLTASGHVPGVSVPDATSNIDVERPDAPVAVAGDPTRLGLEYVGDSRHLLLYGTFADGSKVGLQYSSLTLYTSDNPAVTTVDSTGLVTATGPGFANITITNNGASTTVPVSVPQWVTVMPRSISLNPSGTHQFTPRVVMPPGTDLSVAWSVHPDLGSIDGTGTYTAPSSVDSATRVVVTATLVADPNKSGSANVQLLPPVSISLAPTSATLSAGFTQFFNATVLNAVDLMVNWSVSPAGVGTLDQRGHYTAPATIASPQTVTITATSEADGTKTASAQVTLVPSKDRPRNDPARTQ